MLGAIADARLQKDAIIPVCRRCPRDQRCQQNARGVLTQPKPQSVLFIADEITALAVFTAPAADQSPASAILAQSIFLYALVAAGRSVESIKATVLAKPSVPSIKGCNKDWFIRRSFERSIRSRNSCSIRTSGTAWRLDKCANDLHVRCSLNNSTSKLNEWAGVSNASRLTRNNCAGENRAGRPRLNL